MVLFKLEVAFRFIGTHTRLRECGSESMARDWQLLLASTCGTMFTQPSVGVHDVHIFLGVCGDQTVSVPMVVLFRILPPREEGGDRVGKLVFALGSVLVGLKF